MISEFTFGEYFGIDLLTVAGWAPSLLVFLLAAAAYTKLTRTVASFHWSLGLGVLGAIGWLMTIQVMFVATPSIAEVAWAYSLSAMPIVGSILGWWLVKALTKSVELTAYPSARLHGKSAAHLQR